MPSILRRADLARAYRHGHAGLLRYHGYEILVGPLKLGPRDEHDSFITVRDHDGLPALSVMHRWDGDMVDQHADVLANSSSTLTRDQLLAAHVYSQTITTTLDRRHPDDISHALSHDRVHYYGERPETFAWVLYELLAPHRDLQQAC
jgi:hypothetical protein